MCECVMDHPLAKKYLIRWDCCTVADFRLRQAASSLSWEPPVSHDSWVCSGANTLSMHVVGPQYV